MCEVHADPPPRSFKWKFNSSGESFEIPKDRYYKNGSQSSILHYTPIMDQDYGTLTCMGENDVGEQANPCIFQVILAGELKRCSMTCTSFVFSSAFTPNLLDAVRILTEQTTKHKTSQT